MKNRLILIVSLVASQLSFSSGGVTVEEAFDCLPTQVTSQSLVRFTMAHLPAGWTNTSDVLIYADKNNLGRMTSQLADCRSPKVYKTKEMNSVVNTADLVCGSDVRDGNLFSIATNNKGWYAEIRIVGADVNLKLFNKNSNVLAESNVASDYRCNTVK